MQSCSKSEKKENSSSRYEEENTQLKENHVYFKKLLAGVKQMKTTQFEGSPSLSKFSNEDKKKYINRSFRGSD